MYQTHDEPQPTALSPWAAPTTRHDGWTGERMAKFCEALADSGIVLDACLVVGLSSPSAYAARRRSTLFAAAWDAALTIARDKLADTLLARSIEGSVEQYYKDGELVGEKRIVDNRLGLAMLRRLDRLAETGSAIGNGRLSPSTRSAARPIARPPIDWDKAIAALESGDADDVYAALAMLQGDEVSEVSDPPFSHLSDDDDDDDIEPGEAIRLWEGDGVWWTNFPPPDGFDGVEEGRYGSRDYGRTCTPAEQYLLDAEQDDLRADARARDTEECDRYFAELAQDLIDDGVLGPDLLPASRISADSGTSATSDGLVLSEVQSGENR